MPLSALSQVILSRVALPCRSAKLVPRALRLPVYSRPAAPRSISRTMSSATPSDVEPYLATADNPIATLEAKVAFAGLEAQEARYAAALYHAAWTGYKITLIQSSPESPAVFELLRLVCSQGVARLREAATSRGISADHFELFIAYTAMVFENAGVYRSFGDSRIIPALPADVFETIVKASPAYATDSSRALLDELWGAVGTAIFATSPRILQLGMAPDAVTSYYSGDFTKEDAALIARFVKSKGMLQPYNTRVFKVAAPASASGPGRKHYVMRLASAIKVQEASGAGAGSSTLTGRRYDDVEGHLMLGAHAFEDATIEIARGDMAPLMARVCGHLGEAQSHTSSPLQVRMLSHYIDSFRTGSQEAHVDGSRLWTKDVGPTVESYIGFIESYRDPMGVRGEWEGFCAVVNKATSAKFGKLVEEAESLLPLLPWGRQFEMDRFMRPDFTSLEVLAFGSSGIPAGINIPNYPEVRQVDGFKNVSLGNVLSARDFKDRISFLGDDDQEAFKAYAGPSFEVQVGLHELLGHGSGKLFIEDEAGGLNFDPAAVVNPLAPAGGDASIKSWYKAGASWDTVFGPLASAMEECRAEAVGIFLCVQPRVLEIFGHPGDEDLVYVNWLNMARAGLLALQYYNTASRSWGQAHMQARYALLRVMLEAGGGLVSVEGQGALSLAAVQAGSVAEGEGGVHVRLDRTKIRSVGVPAVGAFLRRLQVYKSTADVEAGTRMFNQYCEVPEPWLALRALVVAKRKPRQMLVQPVIEAVGSEPAFPSESTVTTSKAQGDLQLRDFPATAAGIVDSFAHRFRSVDHDLLALWRADQPFFGADA